MIEIAAMFIAERSKPKAHISHDIPLTDIQRSAFGVWYSAFVHSKVRQTLDCVLGLHNSLELSGPASRLDHRKTTLCVRGY